METRTKRYQWFSAAGLVLAGVMFLNPQVAAQILRIGEMNTQQIQALDLPKTVVLIPGGILEEHGPYLPPTRTAMPMMPTPRPGKVSVLSPALDPNSTTSEVWVEAPNPTRQLEPGSSAEVDIVAKTVPDTVVVPASSVIAEDNGSTTVVTVKPDNTVVSQKVQVGIQEGDKVQIVSGISAGEKVVSSGGYGLPDGTKVQPSANNSPNPQNASKQPVP